MTKAEREKAIDLLDNLRGMLEDSQGNDYDFALKKGIEALEQEPCEDCVSREAVLETIDDCNSDGLKGIFCSYVDGEKFKKYIKELPSVISKGVTVTDFADKCRECGKQKKGHWIITGDYLTAAYGSVDYVKCSCCGKDSLEEGDYCPNCGAKMEE